jgi:hypothetical protein
MPSLYFVILARCSAFSSSRYHIFSMLVEPNKVKYVLSGPFILWIICAAYLYEFESEIQRYFVQKGRE